MSLDSCVTTDMHHKTRSHLLQWLHQVQHRKAGTTASHSSCCHTQPCHPVPQALGTHTTYSLYFLWSSSSLSFALLLVGLLLCYEILQP